MTHAYALVEHKMILHSRLPVNLCLQHARDGRYGASSNPAARTHHDDTCFMTRDYAHVYRKPKNIGQRVFVYWSLLDDHKSIQLLVRTMLQQRSTCRWINPASEGSQECAEVHGNHGHVNVFTCTNWLAYMSVQLAPSQVYRNVRAGTAKKIAVCVGNLVSCSSYLNVPRWLGDGRIFLQNAATKAETRSALQRS